MRLGYSQTDRRRGLSTNELRGLLPVVRADWLLDLDARKTTEGIEIAALAIKNGTPDDAHPAPRSLAPVRGRNLAAVVAQLVQQIAADTTLIPPVEKR